MVKLSFLDSERENDIEVFANDQDQIYISINEDEDCNYRSAWITLDVNTAVKFAKELRRQIALIKNAEPSKTFNNGN